MNNKAQLSVVAFMVAIVIILLALAFAPSVNLFTTTVMNEDLEGFGGEMGNNGHNGLNCGGEDDFIEAACYVVDITQFWFIGGLIALAGVIISAKIIFAN